MSATSKKLFTIITMMVVGLLIGMFSMSQTVYAGEDDDPGDEITKYDLWVNGVQVTSENMDNVLGKTNPETNNPTVKFDPGNNTLTLDDPQGLGQNIEDQHEGSVIFSNGMDLIIEGNCTFDAKTTGIENAIRVISGKLQLRGARLDVAAVFMGIGADGELTISDKSVITSLCNGISGGMASLLGEALYRGGSIYIDDSDVRAEATGSRAISGGRDVTISDSTVDAISPPNNNVLGSLTADANLTIKTGSVVTATGTSYGMVARYIQIEDGTSRVVADGSKAAIDGLFKLVLGEDQLVITEPAGGRVDVPYIRDAKGNIAKHGFFCHNWLP